jgi:Zn-dependent peptidase ImmA (M78 family)
MKYSDIYNEACRIVRLSESRDPLKIARDIGIHVTYENSFSSLKGMYTLIRKNRFIILNGNIDDRLQKMVCAHEIGHDRFHRHLAKGGALQEFVLYDMRVRPEYEANLFAADLLIDDNDILELIKNEYDVIQIAAELETDINLALIKIDGLRQRGYDVRAPYRPQSDFLG